MGFFDSFRPVWGWQEVSPPFLSIGQFIICETNCITVQNKKAKKSKKSKKGEKGEKTDAASIEASPSANGTGAATNGQVKKRHAHAAPRVEEVEDE